MKTYLPAAALVVGVVLLGGSVLWAIIFPASRDWTEEKSNRMTQLGNRASEIDRQLQQTPNADLQKQREKIDEEYKKLYEEFTGVSEAPKTASRILRWSGIAFIVAGAFIVFANRSA
jgi:hypothetical protein